MEGFMTAGVAGSGALRPTQGPLGLQQREVYVVYNQWYLFAQIV